MWLISTKLVAFFFFFRRNILPAMDDSPSVAISGLEMSFDSLSVEFSMYNMKSWGNAIKGGIAVTG